MLGMVASVLGVGALLWLNTTAQCVQLMSWHAPTAVLHCLFLQSHGVRQTLHNPCLA
jgi:hypothetical protein